MMSKEVRWLCVRCARKEMVETKDEPVLLRECASCGIENFTRPVGVVGEVVESIEVPEADDAVTEESPSSGAEPEIPEEAPVEEEEFTEEELKSIDRAIKSAQEGPLELHISGNVTESTIEQLKAQIADMEAKIAAAKETENET